LRDLVLVMNPRVQAPKKKKDLDCMKVVRCEKMNQLNIIFTAPTILKLEYRFVELKVYIFIFVLISHFYVYL